MIHLFLHSVLEMGSKTCTLVNLLLSPSGIGIALCYINRHQNKSSVETGIEDSAYGRAVIEFAKF